MATSTGAPKDKNPEYNRFSTAKPSTPNTPKVESRTLRGFSWAEVIRTRLGKKLEGITRDFQGDGTF